MERIEQSSAAELRARLDQLEQEHRALTFRYVEAERESSNLALLYVAGRRLRDTLDRDEVLTIIQEIVANMVGSEEVAVFERCAGAVLRLVHAAGVDAARLAELELGCGAIGRAAHDGQIALIDPHTELMAHERGLTACIPLCCAGRVTGVIAVFRLLPQKAELVPFDRELFEVLSLDGALALYLCDLHAGRSAAMRDQP